MDDRRTSSTRAPERSGNTLHTVSGVEAILGMRDLLIEFSLRCDQAGTMEDLHYFLTKPGLMKRTPKLLLVSRHADRRLEEIRVDDLVGALLVYEFALMGVRAFATNDRSGRGTLLAPAMHRAEVASIAAKALLEGGAQLVLLSFQTGLSEGQISGGGFDLSGCSMKIKWTHRERTLDGYLPLEPTYDGTRARLGQKTRSHMRYYRRRAESQLGCRFVAAVTMGREEYVALNRLCMFRVSNKVAEWRFDSQKTLCDPVMFGLKGESGEWLSIVGGRRFYDRTEVLWQMNRDGYPTHSLATVMRSYYLEHEIGEGKKRFYVEGGTKHSIHHSFAKEQLIDFVAVRQSWASL